MGPRYAELHCHSNFSFLEGADFPRDLLARAAELGLEALALTDRDGLYGAVRFHEAASHHSAIQPIYGSTLSLEDGSQLTVLIQNPTGYRNLAGLITEGRRACEKGVCRIPRISLAERNEGLIVLSGDQQGAIAQAFLQDTPQVAAEELGWLKEVFGDRFYLEIHNHLLPMDRYLRDCLRGLGQRHGVPRVATNQVLYATPESRPRHDVLSCIRQHTTLELAGTQLRPNGCYHLKSAAEMARLFREDPDAIENTLLVAARCGYRMDALPYRLPDYPLPDGTDAQSFLEEKVWAGARWRYADRLDQDPRIRKQLKHELATIGKMKLASYFLIMWEISSWCHEHRILCQGRGSAANSAACFCLGITAVDPIGLELLFERFLNEARSGYPDIDLDIANGDREQVIQWVYQRYGRERAAMVCNLITYRRKSALRDIGKALGFSLNQVDVLAKNLRRRPPSAKKPQPDPSSSATGKTGRRRAPGRVRSRTGYGPIQDFPLAELPVSLRRSNRGPAQGDTPEPGAGSFTDSGKRIMVDDPLYGAEDLLPFEAPRVALLRRMMREITDFPRHLGIHSGGMVVSSLPLGEICPIENATMADRTVLQWDKDDVNLMGLVKLDLLGLGMLQVIQEATKMMAAEGHEFDMARLTHDDPAVFDMMCRADTVGLFQVESRAQMNTLPRLKPRCFYDLVVQVALIRPGPIQGQMVHPYLERRAGRQKVEYPHPDLVPILKRTLGIPLFQEQAMRVAIVAGRFTAAQAERLRKTMGFRRASQEQERLLGLMVENMVGAGYPLETAEKIRDLCRGFAGYGFPESHAASFALIVYASAWLKFYVPAAFYAALLNCQPMGFYAPSSLVTDARRFGVRVLPLDINRSCWDWAVVWSDDPERKGAIRAGLRQVKGLSEAHAQQIEAARQAQPFRSVEDFCHRVHIPQIYRERLAELGAFGCFPVRRRQALWQTQGHQLTLPLQKLKPEGAPPALPALSPLERNLIDHRYAGFSADVYPTAYLRGWLDEQGVTVADRLKARPAESPVKVAGIVITRQQPPTAKGVVFLTLEDETGLINIIIYPKIFAEQHRQVRRSRIVLVEGRLQLEQGVVQIIARQLHPLDDRLNAVAVRSRDFH